MEKFQDRQIDKDELQNKKAVEENVTENETVEFQARDDVKIVIIEDKDKTVRTDPSSLWVLFETRGNILFDVLYITFLCT